MDVDLFFQHLWEQYIAVTPQAQRIHDAVAACNGKVRNDHVAFRTFRYAPLDIHHLQPILGDLGYRPFDRYVFRQKKLEAAAYMHADPAHPKIFLSELLIDQLSARARDIIVTTLTNTPLDAPRDPGFFFQGTPWPMITSKDYFCLLDESEYAAWLLVMGYRANHFTIDVNTLSRAPSLDAVIETVRSLGYAMNESGGLIKGSASLGLQQAATLADEMQVTFADGITTRVKTCFYEFALRYSLGEEGLFQGFVEQNADRIFESTFQQRVG